MKVGKNEEKPVTTIDFTSLISAIAQVIAAYAAFIVAIRHRK